MDAFDALKDRIELYNLLWMCSQTEEQKEMDDKFNHAIVKLLDVKEDS
jgi:hypothetical protein